MIKEWNAEFLTMLSVFFAIQKTILANKRTLFCIVLLAAVCNCHFGLKIKGRQKYAWASA